MMLALSSLYGAEYHVSINGLDTHDGSAAKPLRHIQAAADLAQPGDVVTVHEGVYREYVNPPRGGTSDDKRIVYQAAPDEKVIIKGSEVIKDWKKVANDTWTVTLPNSFFGDYNPYNTVIEGDWCRTGKIPLHAGTVYLNGTWINEAITKKQVLAPYRKSPYWFAEVSDEHTTIWAQFDGVDPNRELVEINVRQCIFYPEEPGRNYITVRGFTMRQAATQWSGAMSEQFGLIGTHWSKGWIIEDNIISHSMNTGITLGRYDLARFGATKPRQSATGFVKSCELALKHGWSKDNIGSHVVRNNYISHCEKNGIHGSLGGVFSLIEGNTIHDIGQRGWFDGADIAGLKLLGSNDVIIRNNHIYRCVRFGGIWLDWMAQGTRVAGNLLHDNYTDLFFEVDHGPFLADNNLFLSSYSLRDYSQGSAYVHNLVVGRIRSVSENRQTPYFKPHTLKEMKLCDIKHRDARFFNNAFLGQYPSLGYIEERLQLVGNVHPQGLSVTLEEKEDGFWLRMPKLPEATDSVLVTTELLGKAAIPDAPFEKPDGTPYRLDRDYFGKKRSVDKPAPGPFAKQDGEEILIKVWPKQ
jgi:alpha-N-arabinofuranosidase